jgi:uncharacterized membrane protein YccC
MIHRDDLRLAACVGVAAGLGSISSVPDGYYLPLTVAAVMVGSYGSSYGLGLQRVICTLLGGLVLLIAQPALVSLPFPFGLALMLGMIRLIGGVLGLQAGYKITGLVVIMGWLMQPTAVSSWLGLKLTWTALGVVLALLTLHGFWPSLAIREHHGSLVALLDLQREALQEQRQLLLESCLGRLSPRSRKQRHRQLMRALIQVQSSRPAAVLELGANPYSQPQMHLWSELERCCAALAGCLTALRALREPLAGSPLLHDLHRAEAQLLADCAAQLETWQAALHHDRAAWLVTAEPGRLQGDLDHLRHTEQVLFAQDDLPAAFDPAQQRQVARRLLLCYQLAALLQRMDGRWQELTGSSSRRSSGRVAPAYQ